MGDHVVEPDVRLAEPGLLEDERRAVDIPGPRGVVEAFTRVAGRPGPLWMNNLASLPLVHAIRPPPVPGTCSNVGVFLTGIYGCGRGRS